MLIAIAHRPQAMAGAAARMDRGSGFIAERLLASERERLGVAGQRGRAGARRAGPALAPSPEIGGGGTLRRRRRVRQILTVT